MTRWGATVASLLRLHEALFGGLRRFSLPLICRTSKTNIQTSRRNCSLQRQVLRAYPGFPRSTATNATIAEPGQLPIVALQEQDSEKSDARHNTSSLRNACMTGTPPPLSGIHSKHRRHVPDVSTLWTISLIPRGYPRIFIDIPGISKKASLPYIQFRQLIRSVFSERHQSGIHSALGVVSTKLGVTSQHKQSQNTSSTASELAAIPEAVRYIISQPPQRWTVFNYSKPALQVLKNAGRRTICFQLALDTQLLLSTSFQLGHSVALQWVPAHCGIPGNELADAAANATLRSTSTVHIPFALSDVN